MKKYIFENNKVELILEQIGCKNIVYHSAKDYYSCSNYDGDNKSAVVCYNTKYLSVRNYTRADFDSSSDIFTLIQYNRRCDFLSAVKWTHQVLGIEYSYDKVKEQKSTDPLDIFKRYLVKRTVVNVNDITYNDENALSDFTPVVHIDLYREGIMPWTAKKFGLGYSYKWKRQIFPHRYWLNGELLGFNARTMVPNYDLLGINKYYISPGMNKSINLYGLWENRSEIEKKGFAVIFESEKSVLKRDSLYDPTGVALSGHVISDEQVRIICGLEINEVVIALDKDISLNEVRHMCEKFYQIKKVSYIYDKWDLLKEKDSPADAIDKIYWFLFGHRQEYNASEHSEYIKSLTTNNEGKLNQNAKNICTA